MRRRLCEVKAVVVRVPRAHVGGVSRVRGVEGRASDREILLDGLSGNAADDVNAELEVEPVQIFCERLES